MKKMTGPIAGMMASILSKYNQHVAQLKADSKSKYGFAQKLGFNIPFVSPKRLAEQFDTSTKTLERLRKNGEGPPFIKLCTKQIAIRLSGWKHG